MLQIENYHNGEDNPYNHTAGDTLAQMNLDYWFEQVRLAAAAAVWLLER